MKVKMGPADRTVTWTMADRIVAWFSPAAGMERLKARVVMDASGGFKAASQSSRAMRNWWTTETSANADISPGLPRMRARSRDLVRNTPLATGAVNTVVTNVVGDGLVLKAQIDRSVLNMTTEQADAWEAAAEREFAIWAKRPDFTDRQNFDGLQQLALRSMLESGDCFVVRRRRIDRGDVYGVKLQLVEADRVCNENGARNTETMVDGVQLDSDGRPVGYWFSSHHPGDSLWNSNRTWKYLDKGATATGTPLILHLYHQTRIDQARGLPYLAPVVETLKQLGDYSDAEIRAAVISAMFTVFITRPAAEIDGEPIIGTNGADNINSDTEVSLGSGAVIDLAEGEKPEFADPKRPNSAFDAFVMAMSRHIGVALELPVELLLKSFTASYSASRAALEMAWQFFRVRRSWLAWNFCQPVYEWVITEAVAAGRLSAPGFFADPVIREAWLGSDWIGPAHIQLDPQKEAAADLIDLNMNVKTRDQIIRERTGGSFVQKVAQLEKEKLALDAAGLPTAQSASQALQPPPQPPADQPAP